MEFVIGYMGALLIAITDKTLGRKSPENYKELMKTDAYAKDKALQDILNEQPRDENDEVL